MLDLSGKTALITGGARRLGRAIAEALAADGATIIIHYNTARTEAEAARQAIIEQGRAAWTVAADLAIPDAARRCFEEAATLVGPIDILVNNASVFQTSDLLTFPDPVWDRDVTLHALAPLILARALAAQGRPGNVINMLDTRITGPAHRHAAYGIGKRLLAMLTGDLALELAPTVRVNGVAPGLILPPPGHDDAYLAALHDTVPLRRHGGTTDIVAACRYLIGAEFVTGQILFVDGGAHVQGGQHA